MIPYIGVFCVPSIVLFIYVLVSANLTRLIHITTSMETETDISQCLSVPHPISNRSQPPPFSCAPGSVLAVHICTHPWGDGLLQAEIIEREILRVRDLLRLDH